MPTTALHIIDSLTAFGIAGSTGYSLELAFVANEAISRVNYCQPAYTLTRLYVSLSALFSQLFVGFSCCFVQPCVSLDAASIITLDFKPIDKNMNDYHGCLCRCSYDAAKRFYSYFSSPSYNM